ncbi:MAG TPA: DUF885 domain-containing protein [Euzebyales bacterium]
MTSGMHQLADEVHDTVMALSPLEASVLGDRRFDAMLPDVSPAGRAAAREALGRLDDRVAALDDRVLTRDERVTADVARHTIAQARHELDDRYVRTAAGPIASGAGIGSPVSALLATLPKVALTNPEQARDHLTRCGRIPDWLEATESQLRSGVATGCVPAARLVALTIRQLDRYLGTPISDDPLRRAPSGGTGDPGRWRAALADIVDTRIRPALRRHRDVLADEIAPAARRDAEVGLVHLPGGDELYRDAVAVHTTTATTPERYHELGLELIAALADEYRDLGGRVLGTTRLDEIFARLRDDPALRFVSADQIHATAAASLRRAQQAMPDWFGDVGTIACEVRPIPDVEAPESTIAYYQPPTLDGTRPGTYYVNTSDPTTRPRFEAEVLAFHESVPGHHTQIATALELDLPTLRRVRYLTAYAEGWGLYVERLADEMGLYSGDLDRLGMLSFDSWRACRLVVDTGMHALGWSRDRAIAFMLDNSPLAANNVANEVDRYIGWPGQALAYMAGRLRIVELRDHARRTLGPGFDIAAFHDAVLGCGPVPLRTLQSLVDDWTRATSGHPG